MFRGFRPRRKCPAGGLLLTLALAAAAAADDHGNTPGTATPISTDGSPVAGNIEPPGDVDYFWFAASAGRLYTVETSNLGPGCDTYLTLYAPDGFTILFEDDQGGDEPYASKIVFEATQSAVYYVEVSHWLLEYGTGTYDLSVTDEGVAPPDDHGDTPATATLIAAGTPVAGDIEVPGDEDFFTFPAQAGGFYDVETFALPAGSDTFLTLFDNDGTSQLLTDDQGGRETNASRIIFQASTIQGIGQYYVSVVQFLRNATGAYQLRLTDIGTPVSATPDGTLIPGTIDQAGGVDAFAFSALRGHSYRIELQDAETAAFRLTLLDTDGMAEIEESVLGYPSIVFVPDRKGTYYVLVREDFAGGDYAFRVTDGGLPPPDPDFDKDGIVGASDLLIFQQYWHWGTPTPTPVPSPTPTPPAGGG